MPLRECTFGFVICLLAASAVRAGDDALERPAKIAAPLELPHVTDLELAAKARKKNRRAPNIESTALLDLDAGLKPVAWPRNSDIRARILTPELRSTPVVGWVAANLYRSRKENGWCLEVDPGEGEYLVFYRLNVK
jgi:hypothetical protein